MFILLFVIYSISIVSNILITNTFLIYSYRAEYGMNNSVSVYLTIQAHENDPKHLRILLQIR